MRSLSSYLASRAANWATTTIISLAALSSLIPSVAAITFTDAPPSNLRLDDLGRVALAGNFDGLSLFQYLEQNEDIYNTNGSHSILARFPNGAFTSVSLADAHIKAMCPWIQEGQLKGITVAGNFTSLGGLQSQAIAAIDPATGAVMQLPGLSGKVSALYCDSQSGYVYVGGEFQGLNSTNAIVWTGKWDNMPFAGFKGPVTSITKATNGNIIFAGNFDGVGNGTRGTRENNTQVLPVGSGDVTALYSIQRNGFDNPRNIICKTAETDGAGNTWLAPDNTPSYWQTKLRFGFQPSKLRLYNTQFEGRGTKTWRYTALPDTGIMNMTYVNPDGERAYCDARCPLPEGNTTFQDFEFVNSIGMNGFKIDISEWYGAGAGLAGIELFQDEIFSYAINDFNEPVCDDVNPTAATASTTGPWIVSPSGQSNSDYLSVRVNQTTSDTTDLSVVFRPTLEQSGNYTVSIYTPGCIQDNTCNLRGRVNVTTNMGGSSTDGANQPPFTEIFQTNNFDKYDTIYTGFIDAGSNGFQPSVTLRPSAGQTPELGFITFVAQRVRFELISPSSGGLNGVFEYNPNQALINMDFEKSAINRAGNTLDDGATIKELHSYGKTGEIFLGGDFTAQSFHNIFKISDDNATSLAQGGLNNEVMAFCPDLDNEDLLYIGGNFTNTRENGIEGLNGIALYSMADDKWTTLGAGVNGIVQTIVPFTVPVNGQDERVYAVSGIFDSILAFGNSPASDVQGFAIWVPARSNWLQNTDLATILLEGKLSTWSTVPNGDPLYAGSVSSQSLAASGAVGLRDSNGLQLQQLPLRIQPSSTSTSSRKRSATLNGQNVTGAATGLIYEEEGLNYTVIAGHFRAAASDGKAINNLLIIDGTNTPTGIRDELPADSTFVTVGLQNRQNTPLLFAGGSVTGEGINGIVIYDLGAKKLRGNQPQGLASDDEVIVNAIAVQRNSADVYIAGDFDSAGSLSCPSLCIYNTDLNQWNQPGNGLTGPVSVLQWTSDTLLMLAGNITVGPNTTTLATYDTESRAFSSFPGAESIPGPITAISAANAERSKFWVAGTATNGSAFLRKYDGSQWHSVGHLLGPDSVISGVQVMPLSENHDGTDLVERNRALFVMGQLQVPTFGNASSALFDGTRFVPFILASSSSGAGSISHAFVQRENFFSNEDGRMAIGFVILIALAISLGLIALIVLAGILAERWRRRRDGYVPANQVMMSGGADGNMSRIRPEALFGTLGKRDMAPKLA